VRADLDAAYAALEAELAAIGGVIAAEDNFPAVGALFRRQAGVFMRALIALAVVISLGLAALFWLTGGDRVVLAWAVEGQRAAQGGMGRALGALRQATRRRSCRLLGVCFLYGFFHAAGPGHGKLLIGGYGAARAVGAWRLSAVALASSLAQGVTAILLVGAGRLAPELEPGPHDRPRRAAVAAAGLRGHRADRPVAGAGFAPDRGVARRDSLAAPVDVGSRSGHGHRDHDHHHHHGTTTAIAAMPMRPPPSRLRPPPPTRELLALIGRWRSGPAPGRSSF
jgi:nickel/cobalt exporter